MVLPLSEVRVVGEELVSAAELRSLDAAPLQHQSLLCSKGCVFLLSIFLPTLLE